ncbi:MAG: FHA domain-containing protein, partial [Rubrivivax sp.]
MFTINVTTAKGESSTHPLQGNAATIGKADDNAVQLKGWTIGKRHASVVIRDGKPYVEDHGGLSVTEVNGKAVDEIYGPLKDTDIISIGGYELRVTNEAAPSRSVSDGDIAAAQPSTPSIEDMLSATLSKPMPAYSPKPLSPAQMLPAGGDAAPAPRAPAPAPVAAPAAEATPGGVNHARPPVLKEQRVDAPAGAPAFDPNMTMRTMARVQADERVIHMNRARQAVHTKLISMMDLRRVDVARMAEGELRSTTSALVHEIIADARDIPHDVDRDQLTK